MAIIHGQFRRPARRLVWVLIPLLVLGPGTPIHAPLLAQPPARVAQEQKDITADDVRQAIDRGVEYLKRQQSAERGNWPESYGGETHLVMLALLSCGVPAKDPVVQRGLDYLRSQGNPKKTYQTSLQTMVFCAAEPERDMLLIRRNAAWLESIQIKTGDDNGSWGYGEGSDRGDNSNAQFALLALYEAERAGVEVQQSTWNRALRHWEKQLGDPPTRDAWGYKTGDSPTGSMTAAGISSVLIASGQVSKGDAGVSENGKVLCCRPQQSSDAIERALRWLGNNFSVERNPAFGGLRGDYDQNWVLYYLYGVERVGRLSAQRFIGKHDWYRAGVKHWVPEQDRLNGSWMRKGTAESNTLVATSLVLLFLSKGRRPVLVSKYKRDGGREGIDWNLHRGDLASLTHHVEKLWKRDMTWQVIDSRVATLEDLLQTPVLYITGRDELKLTAEQKQNLQQYVENGGFILADNCCGEGSQFDVDFRELMKELFPQSPLRLLPPDHPLWWAETPVKPDARDLYYIDACCRTSIVYSPKTLSCYWELAGAGRDRVYPADVQQEIDDCLAIGANVLAYATNRELKDKLDAPRIQAADVERDLERGVLFVAKLRHTGGSDDAPAALGNLLTFVGTQAELPIDGGRRVVAVTDESLPEYPIVFMHGRRNFQLQAADRRALARYLENGGVLFADAICASPEFTEAFKRELQAIFPSARLRQLPADHPIFTTEFRGFDIKKVNLREPATRGEGDGQKTNVREITPVIEALEIEGRLAVFFSPYDISCALENTPSLECRGYSREDAAKIGTNIILYALQQ